jgi:hypothetical protein
MSERGKDQIPANLPKTAQEPAPIFLPKNPSDRDKSWINKMVRKEFYYPPARKRRVSH